MTARTIHEYSAKNMFFRLKVSDFVEAEGIKILDWPAQSSGFKPNREHLERVATGEVS